jgi:hypothetical protein
MYNVSMSSLFFIEKVAQNITQSVNNGSQRSFYHYNRFGYLIGFLASRHSCRRMIYSKKIFRL